MTAFGRAWCGGSAAKRLSQQRRLPAYATRWTGRTIVPNKKSSKKSTSATGLTAGAHGPNPGDRNSSTSSASLPVCNLPVVSGSTFRSTPTLFPFGAVILKRSFTRPQRKPVSRPPLRGQRSRPTSSTSHRTFTESAPVRCSRVPHLLPLPFRISTPFRIKAFSRFSPLEAHLRKASDFPSLPVARLHF